MKKLLITLVILGLAMFANAQVETIAETMGKSKTALFVSANALVIRDFTTASFSTAQLWYGATNRVDVFTGISETTLLGQEQTALGIGGNVNLLKSKALSVSTFNVLSLPINRRSDACGASWFTALVMSKSLQIRKFAFTPYGGYSVTVPLGQTADKLFTPAKPVYNIPVGVMIPKGKFAFFAEYDFGRTQQIVGIGIAYTPSP